MVGSKGYGEQVLMEKPKPGLVKITLNRPEKRNAMTVQAISELRAALEDSWDCHVGIITGSGPAFCAGVDLREFQERQERQARGEEAPRTYANAPTSWGETNLCVTRHPAVFVAAVNGFAIGGGVSLINSCDLAIASDRAEFGITEMGFATFPSLVAPLTSKRILPKHLAWMVFTAQRIEAETAEQWGLVNRVVPHDQLMEETEKLADRLLQLDPYVVDYAKKALTVLPLIPYEMAGHYGQLVGTQVRSGRGRMGADSLSHFLSGKPGLGQGSDPR